MLTSPVQASYLYTRERGEMDLRATRQPKTPGGGALQRSPVLTSLPRTPLTLRSTQWPCDLRGLLNPVLSLKICEDNDLSIACPPGFFQKTKGLRYGSPLKASTSMCVTCDFQAGVTLAHIILQEPKPSHKHQLSPKCTSGTCKRSY